MSQEINEHIVQAIVEVAVFLEFSGESEINQDAAVQVFEQLASTLQMMDSGAKSSLCSQFQKIAQDYSGERGMFVGNLGEALGLAEE